MKKITSLQNPLVKHLVNVRKDKQYRHAQRTVLVEGKKLVNELAAIIEPLRIFFTQPELLTSKVSSEECFQVTEVIMKKISGVQTPEGIAGEFPLPKESSFDNINFLIALDGVSDPGNMGTLLRTALALGWEGAFLLDNCCDPFNDKALRAAKGATFRLPLQTGNWQKLEQVVRKNRLRPMAADIEGADVSSLAHENKVLLVLGSEAEGLSSESLSHCEKITIPMSGKIESLNVSIAGGILMFLLRERKHAL